MPQSFACLHYHIIFATKDREPMITPDLQPRLNDYIGGIIHTTGGCLVAVGGISDHVHLLASLSKQESISESLRKIKAGSSGWIHETFPRKASFAWQTGYAAFATSYSHLERVKHYIAGQVEHHRVRCFKEELVEFLKRHEVAFDERYLLE